MRYKILSLDDPDYGCEEFPKDGPHVSILIESDDGDKTRIERPESWLTERGLDKGSYFEI